MNRRTGGAIAGIVLLGLLAGCTGSNTAASGAQPANAAGGARAASPGVLDKAASGQAAAGQAVPGQAQGLAPAQAERHVVRTAQVELRGNDVKDTLHKARDEATSVGGYVGAEDSRPERGSLTLQVPADKLDGVLDYLGGLGEVVARTEHAEDVTEQVVDVESRLTSQRASVARVRALLDRASSVSEVVEVEGELTRREADLESLQRRHDVLSAQVAMSTVSVGVTRRDAPAPVAASTGGFVGGLSAGWHAMSASLHVVLTVLGVVLPFAAVIGVPVGVVFVLRRRWQARRAS